uniref:NADH dehydrogenase subunit 6 n=1 Tax=Philometroides sanguineus TaxID=378106 RepID=A0A0U1XA54_9BILA|nr:NADH dehydrogenase subunit 6 [Philometroides sanguineus]AIN37101.1 NADH dehydrogenase subunit 6 [Philometroides sanguineus]
MLLAMSLILCLMSFLSSDPMKSALSLVGSLLFLLPTISCSLHVWYSYYICLLFLSGIFVVIVYFSSLSSFSVYDYGLSVGVIMFCMFLMGSNYLNLGCEYSSSSSLDCVVVDEYWFIYTWMFFVLFIFLGFMSYFLTFEGALRKF